MEQDKLKSLLTLIISQTENDQLTTIDDIIQCMVSEFPNLFSLKA